MKVKIKLTLMTLMFAILPALMLSIIAFCYFENLNTETRTQNITKSIINESQNIELVFNDIITRTKEISSISEIKEYSELSNKANFNPTDEDTADKETYALSILKSSQKISGYAINTKVVNNNGIIVLSSDESEVGETSDLVKQYQDNTLANNGVSGFDNKNVNGEDIVYFYIVRNIYSSDNIKQGILYQEFNTQFLQNIITNTKVDNFTSVVLMDDAGNVLMAPYNTIIKYYRSSQLMVVQNSLDKILNAPVGGANDSDLVLNEDNKNLSYSKIDNCRWSLVGITNLENMKSYYSNNTSTLKALFFLVGLVIAVLVFVYIAKFTAPIYAITHTLRKKQKGDINAKFTVTTHDEFGDIAEALNVLFNDVTENEQRYRTIVEMTNNIIFEINFKVNSVFVSKNFNKLFSFRPKDETLQESFFYKARIHKDDKERFTHDIDRIIQTSNFMQGEYRIKNIYGEFSWVQIKANKFYDRNEIPTKIVGVIADIDREKKSEMHLVQRACYDNLTQLYNRETFKKNLEAEMERSREKKTLDALLFIDLDDFKFFNDQYTHACGDEVLKFVADTLKEITFEKGFAGRMGGDEFVVCVKNLTLIGDIGKIAQEIIDILGEGFVSEINGINLTIHCSIGIAFFRENGETPEQLIAAADEAMYIIKKHGKSAFTYAKSVSKQI